MPDESLSVTIVILGCELPPFESTNLDILASASSVFSYFVVIIPVHNERVKRFSYQFNPVCLVFSHYVAILTVCGIIGTSTN